jgi:hypothetical protein
MKFELIAISGKAGTGKDFIYDTHLRPLGYHRWALADHFKIWLAGQGKWGYDDVFHNKPPAVRSDLQQEGTERGRNVFGDNIWCNVTLTWFRLLNETWGINKFIITDIRFPNEVAFVQENGGKVIRIHAPKRAAKSKLTEIQKQHISETALDHFDKFDGILYNDPEHSETVKRQLKDLLNEEETESFFEGFDEMFDKIGEAIDGVSDRMDNMSDKMDRIFKRIK